MASKYRIDTVYIRNDDSNKVYFQAFITLCPSCLSEYILYWVDEKELIPQTPQPTSINFFCPYCGENIAKGG